MTKGLRNGLRIYLSYCLLMLGVLLVLEAWGTILPFFTGMLRTAFSRAAWDLVLAWAVLAMVPGISVLLGHQVYRTIKEGFDFVERHVTVPMVTERDLAGRSRPVLGRK